MTVKSAEKKTTTAVSKKPAAKKAAEPAPVNLPSNPFMFEILALVDKQRTKAKKIEILRRYEDSALKAILIWNFDDSIESALPSGEVPYSNVMEGSLASGNLSDKIEDSIRKMDASGSNTLGMLSEQRQNEFTTIRREASKLYNFVKGGNPTLTNMRRETMFISILEGVHPREAEILLLVKDKKLQTKYKITKELVAEAFPDIKWGNRS